MKSKVWKCAVTAAACLGLMLPMSGGGAAPAAPTGLKVPALSADDSSVLLLWDRPVKGDTAAYYNIYANGQRIGSTKTLQDTAAGREIKNFAAENPELCGDLLRQHNYEVRNLKPETTYAFTVRAVDKNGAESSDSATVNQMTKAVPTVVRITDYGAVGDGKTVNTAALQRAINAVPAGGVLEIPQGTFVSGAVQLKSDMTLRLDEGAVLLESADPADLVMQKNGRYNGLLNADSVENLRIVGAGAIDGNGWTMDASGTKYLKAKNKENKGLRDDRHVLNIGIAAKNQTQAQIDAGLAFKKAYNARSTTVILKHVKGLYLEGVTFRNPAMHMLTVEGDDVLLNNVNVRTYDANNGDGIDYDGKGLTIVNSFFDTGDDAINFSAGIGKKATALPPVSDIWLFNNYVAHGHGGIVLGSHTASWIENMLAEDNVFNKTEISLRCKTGQGVGGGGRNVTFRHNVAKDMKRQGIIFTTAYTDVNAVGSFEPADPGQFHDILVEDCAIDGTGKAAIEIDGLPEMPHRSITFRNIRFTRTHENIVNNAQDIVCENVTYDYAK
ncbi:glycoside hydrolase family 28 protein [Selenomonas sp. WCA-380-WT-3B 3/]|uniref:Glycoside hydrolase family 28 protein n=1 Tax=Selenomonas montiformis TaxID=2652285 RepID=A0A6I2V0F3_9FIRM|nr:glycoside hydrolase family 28 protein [Selenomonas montiformis]MSV25820.1 glycoside hydrolase family 28 protein [Selenomonas montiformis]